jgi:hypothetical protein
MAIFREFSQVLHANVDQIGFARPSHNPMLQRT